MSVMRLSSNAVRGCIVAPKSRKFCVADLSNIEGRGLAYLASERWKLKAFQDYDQDIGKDLYIMAYARSFGVDPDSVDPEQATGSADKVQRKAMRQIGKVQELGLGYEGGVGAFLTFAAVYNLDLDKLAEAVHTNAPPEWIEAAQGMLAWFKKKRRSMYGLSEHVWLACEALVLMWRDAHPKTREFWGAARDAVISAIVEPGQTFSAGQHIRVRVDGSWLRCRLPSGRYLCYLHPEVELKVSKDADGTPRTEKLISYFGVDQYTRQWKRIKTYGGKLCIARDTLVLTHRGWLPIQDVTPAHRLWDGVEWISNEGLLPKGRQHVIQAYGAWMTGGHEVLTEEGWKRASQSTRYKRAACRLPDGYPLPREQRAPLNMADPLRLRAVGFYGRIGVTETEESRSNRVVRLPAQRYDSSALNRSRNEHAPGVCGVAVDVRSVQADDASCLAQLRCAWNPGVRTVAPFFRSVLGGHGANLQERPNAGSERQQRQLLQSKLPVDNLESSSEQQAHVKEVFDIFRCGPRLRFTIWAGDAPLIVHNCENWTQAFARDVMAWNMPAIEGAGYEIVLTVHDEVVTETPDSEDFNAEQLSAMLATNPPWAEGLPLAAAGFEAYRYRKD